MIMRLKWTSLSFILALIAGITGIADAQNRVTKDQAEEESSGVAECGLLRLTVEEDGFDNKGRQLYTITAEFVHQATVRDERAPFVPKNKHDREHIDRQGAFGWGAFFYHDREQFADVDRANAQNFGGNPNIRGNEWDERSYPLKRGQRRGMGRRVTAITLEQIPDPEKWNVAGVTYVGYGPDTALQDDPWLAQMKAVSQYSIQERGTLSLRRVNYRVQDEWPDDPNDWGRLTRWGGDDS